MAQPLPTVTQALPAAHAAAPKNSLHVYVADAPAHAIVVYSAGDSAPIATQALPSSPFDVAEDAAGDLAVSYALTNEVVEYGSGFNAIRTLSIVRPNGVVFDDRGNLYVAEMDTNVVKVFQPGRTRAAQVIVPVGRVYVYGGLVVKDNALYMDVSNQGSGGIVERCPLYRVNIAPCRITQAMGAYPGGIAFDAAGEFVVGGAGTFIWFQPPSMQQLRAQYLGVGNAIRGMRSYDGTVYAAVQEKCGDDALPAVTSDSRAWALGLLHTSCAGSRIVAIAPDGSETAYTGLQSPLGVAVGL